MTKRRNLSVLICVSALLAIAPLAHADTVFGAVYIGGTTGAIPGTLPPGAPNVTFLLGSVGNPFNLTADTVPAPGNYTINGFLTSGGDSVAYLSGGVLSGSNLDNTLFVFSGFIDLAPGTYTVTHDDGVIVTVGGVTEIDSPSPTSAENSTFHVSTDTGLVPFEIEYAEVDGPPAVLEASGGSFGTFSITPTPEPSSFVLLGSGLLAAAGMIRRRMMA
jgi:PEP-CTERM motif